MGRGETRWLTALHTHCPVLHTATSELLVLFSSHIAHCNHSCDKVLERWSFTLISMAFIYTYIYIYCINIYTYILIIQIRTLQLALYIRIYVCMWHKRLYCTNIPIVFQYKWLQCANGTGNSEATEQIRSRLHHSSDYGIATANHIYHTRLLIHNRTGSPEPHEGERASTCVYCRGRPTLGPHVFLLCCELLSESLSLSEVILPLPSNRANSSVI